MNPRLPKRHPNAARRHCVGGSSSRRTELKATWGNTTCAIDFIFFSPWQSVKMHAASEAYRGAPLAGAEIHLLDTMQHSVLGPRWIYDGCGDPVAVRALVTTIVTGASQSDVEVESEGQMITMPQSVSVRGSGAPGSPVSAIEWVTCHEKGNVTQSITHTYHLDLARVIGSAIEAPIILTGSWDDQPTVTLAGLTPTGE